MMGKIVWVIRHPGGMGHLDCETFEEAMTKWFEGFNIPIKTLDGKPEAFDVSSARVGRYLAGKETP